MISDFLSSFTGSIVEFKDNLPNNTIGSKIKLYDNSKDYGSVDLVILELMNTGILQNPNQSLFK